MKILIDLDGVIADFVTGCLRYFKRPDIKYRDIKWEIEKIFFPDKPASEFWNELGYKFWSTLPMIGAGYELVYFLKTAFGTENLAFCTSPCETEGSIEGKIFWIKKNYPELARNFMVTPVKQFAASRDTLLIDDHEPNIEKFVKAGGKGVLVAAPWNRLIKELDELDSYDPIKVFQEVVQRAIEK